MVDLDLGDARMSLFAILDAANKILPAGITRRIKRRLPIVERIYDRAIATQNFRERFGRKPNLRNPTTFNEKVVFKMLHDRRPLLTRMADKVHARDYVAEKIGAQFLSRIYQVCSSADDIDCHNLPPSFVIKRNLGGSMNIFVRNNSSLHV